MYKRAVLLFLFVFVAFHIPAVAQCAMCRRALEASPEGQAMAGSFRHGILLLMGAPYLMLGSAGFFIFRAYRKKKRSGDVPGSSIS
jgi:hypothetical protein